MEWADTNYRYKKKLTIDHTKVAGNETNFPVLVSVTDSDLKTIGNGGKLRNSNGYDIVFYDAIEKNILSHEIQEYTATTGAIIMWVKIPALSSSVNTVFWMYYSNSDAATDPSSTGTWDTNFKLVCHMQDITTSTIKDSTTYGNNGNKKGVNEPIQTTSGKIGKAQVFDGDADFINCGTDSSLDFPVAMTAEAWCKWSSISDSYGYIACKGNYQPWEFAVGGTSNTDLFGPYLDTDDYQGSSYYLTPITDNDWHHLAFVYNPDVLGGRLYLYVDGALKKTGVSWGGGIQELTANNVIIGNRSLGARCFEGTIDELRLSNTYRSDNWMLTTFNATDNPATFISFGREYLLGHVIPKIPTFDRARFFPRMRLMLLSIINKL